MGSRNMYSIKRMKKVLNAYEEGKEIEAKDILNNENWVIVQNARFNFSGNISYRLKDHKKLLFGN